ncbi:phage repressor protein CI [Rahnella sp. PAMC25617]|uniref:phage repressor protein CI n=1 Tax=Rahnella sp. PAMC25617 TaxID=3399684 RepID=UPI003D367F87
MNFNEGGAKAIDRMLEAYGYRFRQALCEHFGISKSTLATWYTSDKFPGNYIVWCALETNVSLKWLATGEGVKYEHSKSDIDRLESYSLKDGALNLLGHMMFDKVFLPNNLVSAHAVRTESKTYIVDKGITEFSDGEWLVNIEGKFSVRELAFIPVKKVRVLGGGVPFDCSVEDIKIIAKVAGTFIKA